MRHRFSNIPLLVFILTVVALGMGVLYHRVQRGTSLSQSNADAQTQRRTILSMQPDDYVYGDPDATVILFEYADTECPFCKKLYFKIKDIVAEYKERAIPIAIVYRHAPLGIWDKSITEAQAAECVGAELGERGYYTFLNLLYGATPSNNNLDLSALPALAEEAGADDAVFAACMDSLEYLDKIKEQKLSARALGVSAVPHVFIVGAEHIYDVVGNKSKDTFTFFIEQALGRE